MKSFFKRSAVGLAILGMTGSAFAMAGGFIGIEGLRLRPMNGDLDVLRTHISGGTPAIVHADTNAIDTDYNWAWRVFAGARMGDDDFTVSWLRWRSSESESDADAAFINSNPNIRYLGGVTAGPTAFTSSSASVDFDLDEVYAVWGHSVHFNSPWKVRFAAGLEYAHLDSDLDTRGLTATVGTFATAESSSDLKGWGPRAEMDLVYDLPSNFKVFANSNVALLVSRREVEFSRSSAVAGAPGVSQFEDYSTRNVVVPKFGLRLGVGYSFPFGQIGGEGGMGEVCITAGWQVESYIHAIERRGWDFETDPTAPALIGTNDHDTTHVSNFGDHGLFIGLTFKS